MDITINASFLPHTDPEASLAFYRDALGFEVRKDVGYNDMRWITVGPAGRPDMNIVLTPPAADPGITDDERRTIAEMMAKGTYASIMLATTDLDAVSSECRPAAPKSCKSPPTSPGAPATAPSAIQQATRSASRSCAKRAPVGGPRCRSTARLTDGDTMSTATRKGATKGAKSPALHAADSHDLIRVHGARVNNLKDVNVELPKRRLTVFTGVSGSGKSSLVFDTIAAESQRLINETYSAFVQGFMPTLARPEVDVLEGLTTAIIVDQERMGADPRSTVGTATDTGAMLRILFSRLGKPHIGSPQAFSFNVASISGAGAVTMERGGRTVKERRDFNIVGGMCPRCEGRGSVNDIDLTALYDDSKSLNEGALTIPGFSMEGWYGRIFNGCGFFDPDKPIRKFTKKELDALLHKEATKLKIDGVNLTYMGLIPQIKKSFLAKDVEAMQPHIRAFVERAVTFTTCPDCDGTRLSDSGPVVEDQGNAASPMSARCRSATSPNGSAGSTRSRLPRCWRRCSTPSTRSSRSGWATFPSTVRRARCRAVRRSASR